MNRLVVGLLAVLLTGCATMSRFGDDVVVLCVKPPADYRWWDWPLAVVGYPVIVAIWLANGSDERAMCPRDHGGDPGDGRETQTFVLPARRLSQGSLAKPCIGGMTWVGES
jgi:predicted small secreted protein